MVSDAAAFRYDVDAIDVVVKYYHVLDTGVHEIESVFALVSRQGLPEFD